MKVHLFGAASSPGRANFAFKRAADDGEKQFGSEAADFMRKLPVLHSYPRPSPYKKRHLIYSKFSL